MRRRACPCESFLLNTSIWRSISLIFEATLMRQSDGRFRVAFSFRRQLIRPRLKDQPKLREFCQFD